MSVHHCNPNLILFFKMLQLINVLHTKLLIFSGSDDSSSERGGGPAKREVSNDCGALSFFQTD